jgi:SET domain-containing protein
MIRVGESWPKGRGVFAEKQFRKGQLIERVPVIMIPADQLKHVEKTILSNYTFSWGPEFDDGAIAGGFGCFYNHSYEPNAQYIKRVDDGVIDFVALRDIGANEEITINYNGSPDDQSPLWFDRQRWGWFRPDGQRDDSHEP